MGVSALAWIESGNIIGTVIDRHAGKARNIQWNRTGLVVIDRFFGHPAILIGLTVDGHRLRAEGFAIIGNVAFRYCYTFGLEVDLDREAINRFDDIGRLYAITGNAQTVDIGTGRRQVLQANSIASRLKFNLDLDVRPVIPTIGISAGRSEGQAALRRTPHQNIHRPVCTVATGIRVANRQGVGACLIDNDIKRPGITYITTHIQVAGAGETVP